LSRAGRLTSKFEKNVKKSQRNLYFKTSDRVSKNADLYDDRKQLKKLQKNA
jgi:hypothetical protein